MTDHELDTALRALTEVDTDPALAGRVLARLDGPEPVTRAVRWLAAAAAVLVAAFGALSWYAGRPLATPRVWDAAPLALSAPLRLPLVPELAPSPGDSTAPVVPASFTRPPGRDVEGPWPARIPLIGRTPALAITPITDAPLDAPRVEIAPLEIVEIVIPSLDHQ